MGVESRTEVGTDSRNRIRDGVIARAASQSELGTRLESELTVKPELQPSTELKPCESTICELNILRDYEFLDPSEWFVRELLSALSCGRDRERIATLIVTVAFPANDTTNSARFKGRDGQTLLRVTVPGRNGYNYEFISGPALVQMELLYILLYLTEQQFPPYNAEAVYLAQAHAIRSDKIQNKSRRTPAPLAVEVAHNGLSRRVREWLSNGVLKPITLSPFIIKHFDINDVTLVTSETNILIFALQNTELVARPKDDWAKNLLSQFARNVILKENVDGSFSTAP
ncbi:hypothetical protein EVAR_29391_1 [Eumeta japonica]|uniref:Uncharacterized protein n=1 Tax=Eumeta variegata TaxID=151549 RepID=A0A4C1ZVV7_EUMVA|nr:hypothetical protein EVAR_29391_1 [Eumeta japonica]